MFASGSAANAAASRPGLPAHKAGAVLPDSAFANARFTAGAASPVALQTPLDAPMTTWRTAVCPYAPERRPRPAGAEHSRPEGSPTSLAIRTPANFWPTPMSMTAVSMGQQSPFAVSTPFAGMSPIATVPSCKSAAGVPATGPWMSPVSSGSPGSMSLNNGMMLESSLRSPGSMSLNNGMLLESSLRSPGSMSLNNGMMLESSLRSPGSMSLNNGMLLESSLRSPGSMSLNNGMLLESSLQSDSRGSLGGVACSPKSTADSSGLGKDAPSSSSSPGVGWVPAELLRQAGA